MITFHLKQLRSIADLSHHTDSLSTFSKSVFLFVFLSIPLFSFSQFTADGFITTWKTDNPGSSSNTQITIPTIGENPNFDSYDYDIYWEEVGNSTNNGSVLNNTDNVTITFPSAGVYKVQISGVFPSIFFNYAGDAEKILTVEQWGNINWQYLANAFAGCTNLTVPATDAPNLSGVSNTARMFANASSFNEPINHWNTTSITTMNFMFAGASSFNQDLSNWDVSNVTSTNGLSYMFADATAFNQDISSWDVSNVKDMSYMFRNATSFNQDISTWNVSNVTNMTGMFNDAPSFNQILNTWDVSKVTNMGSMFWGASSFNQPLNNWNTGSVTSMVSMFREASVFNQDISSWNISNTSSMTRLFDNSGLSKANYSSILSSWAAQSVQSNVSLGSIGLTYDCEGYVARTKLHATNNWTISGDTKDCSSFVTTWKTDNAGTSPATSITIPTTGTGYNYSVVWEETGNTSNFGVAGPFNDSNAPHTIDFGSSGTYTASIIGDFPRIFFINGGDKAKLLTIEEWGPNQWASMDESFHGCVNLTISATDVPDFTNTTSTSNMFNEASVVNPENIGTWDLSNVSNMAEMFRLATSFNQDISNWNTSSVTNMHRMFEGSSSFNQDISSWDVSAVTDMERMLHNASVFNQNLGGWDISGVTTMNIMLDGSGLSRNNYDNTLIGWASQNVVSGIQLGASGLTYCLGSNARNMLSNNRFWDITGDTEECLPFITTWQTDNPGDSEDNQVNVAINSPSDVNVYWEEVGNTANNGVLENQTGAFTLTFPQAGTYRVEISGSIHGLSFNGGDKEKLLSIEQWGDNQWTSMIAAFSGCNNLVINATDAPNFDNVTTTAYMFKDNLNFNSDIDNWDMSNVVDMTEMFMGASSFNQDLNSWDVSNVTTTLRMFANATSFDGSIDQWDMGNASSVFQMFEGAITFNQPIGIWNTTNFSDAYNLFNSATSFDQDLGAWELASIQNLVGIFENSGISEENYDNSLIGWANNPNTATGANLRSNDLTFCLAAEARQKLINDLGWFIQGDRNSCLAPFITIWKTDNEGSSEDNQITIPVNDNLNYLYEVYWEDVTNSAVNGTLTEQTGSLTITFPQAGTYKVEIKDVFPAIQFFNGNDRLKILSIEQWGEVEWESMEHAFWGASNLVLNATDAPNLSNVNSLRNMFRDADSFDGDLNGWDLSNVNVIQYMFTSTDSFTGKVEQWDVSNVENFSYTFAEASAFDSNLEGWDISSATNLIGLFDNSGLSFENYDNILIGWSALSSLPSNLSLGARGINYCDAESSRNSLINDFSWSISDEGKAGPTPDLNELPDLSGECELQLPTPPTAKDCEGNSVEGTPDITFPITSFGTTVVTWTYDDGNGNTSTQSQNVIITDTTTPVVDQAVLQDVTGGCSVTPDAPTATDNCDGTITAVSNVTFPITTLGSTQVTWTFTDSNGNSTTQSQLVIVSDNESPIPDQSTLTDLTAECSLSEPQAPTATDGCSGTINGVSDINFPITTSGTTVITWTFEDGNGNSTSQTQNVIINDTEPPVPNETELGDITASCEITNLEVPTATDLCFGEVTGVSDASFPITTQGTTIVIWTYTDNNGNSITQEQNLIIADNEEPVPDMTELSVLSTDCDGVITQPNAPSATDNCAGAVVATTNQTFPFTPTEGSQILWEYDDGNGNTSIQFQDIEIIGSDEVTVEESLCENADFTFPDGTEWTGETSQVSTLTNQLGCDSVITTNITVLPLPEVDLGADEVYGCIGEELTFSIDESAIEFETYTISTLFGNSSTDGPLTFEFSNAFAAATTTSNVFVTIELTSADGCIGTDQVQLFDNTMINWSNGVIQNNDPEIVISNAVLPATVDSFEWDFGDGTTNSTDVNPTHTYTENGDYDVTLTVMNECGEESQSNSITIVGIENPLALDDVNSIQIYPNPTTKYLIFSTEKSVKVMIYGLSGKAYISEELDENKSLDVSQLPAGQYVIHLLDEGKLIQSEKIIKIN